jgi:hypothetical protein
MPVIANNKTSITSRPLSLEGIPMNIRIRPVAAVLAAGAVALTLTACGTNSAAGDAAGSQAVQAAPLSNAVAPAPVASLKNLKGNMTEVILDPGFLAGLKSLKLTPGVVGTAALKDATLSFPITGGDATYWTPGTHDPYVESSIRHDGSGISLTDGKTKVELTNFVIDAGKSILTGDVSANGKSVVKGAPLFFLDGRTLQPLTVDKAKNTGVLYGTTVSLTKAAADLLDKTYGTTALTEFFKVGIARITLRLS